MTQPAPTPPATSSRGVLGSRRVRLLLVAIVVGVIALAALAVWYVFLRPAGPPPVGPGAPVIPGAWNLPGSTFLGPILASLA